MDPVLRPPPARPLPPPAACCVAFIAAALLTSRTARAQVNVETLRADLKDHPAFAIVEGSAVGRTGNTDGMIAGGGSLLGLRSGDHLAFARLQGDYTRMGGRTTVARSFAHARYNYGLTSAVATELFGQLQQDRFLRLKMRAVLGAGPRFTLWSSEDLDVYTGVAYMLEHERLEAGVLDGQPHPAHRLSTYVTTALRVTDAGRFTTTTYLQPRLDAPEDYRILSDSTFAFALTKRVQTKVSLVIRFDSEPPVSVHPADLEVRNALAMTF